ncbi:MAG: hypothetical protein PHG48_02115 [Eubacteriales bacterium]|nr:hypothetical protein [Eubacteriales bacterium]
MKRMKSMKRLAAVIAAVSIIGVAGAAMAASPAEIAAELTGRSAEQVAQERAAGKTYGAIAREAGKAEEFKAAMLENRKEVLEEKVSEGVITREQADTVYAKMQENIADCDGTRAAAGREDGEEGCLAGISGAAMRFGGGSGSATGQGTKAGTGGGLGNRGGGAGGKALMRGSGTCLQPAAQ